MNAINSNHATGRAAYLRHTTPQKTDQTQSSPESDAASSSREASTENTAVQETDEGTLTSQEQEMIAEKFPEDPGLSMRLYGRGQSAKTVHPDTVGNHLDVTG